MSLNAKSNIALVGVLIAIVIAIMGLSLPAAPAPTAGATGTVFPHGLTVGDTAHSGQTFTNTTSNAATSTTALGCIQTIATSTATPIAIVFNKTATTSSMLNGQTAKGFVLWTYGKCPR